MELQYIGKESNRLEEVTSGQIAAWDEVRQTYEHPDDVLWRHEVLPALKGVAREKLERRTGLSQREIRRIVNGHVRPSADKWKALARLIAQRWEDARWRE